MDGNRTWGKENGVSINKSYEKGMEVAKAVVKQAIESKVEYLTLFAFSSENWNRSSDEIELIFSLFIKGIDKHLNEFTKNGIKLHFIGENNKLDEKTAIRIKKAENAKVNKPVLNLIIALSYGSRNEILNACNALIKSGKEVTEESFEKSLYTANFPHPDLVIRTGGNFRISNFLLWQIAYSELLFLEKNWPDFKAQDFELAIKELQNRKRKFGK